MQTASFDYELPPERIAQRPADPRDSSRLLILDRKQGSISHKHFYQLPDFLEPSDALVLNETQVIPARLRGKKTPSGGKAEILLLKRLDSMTWEALVGGKGLRPGLTISINDELQAMIIQDIGGSRRIVEFSTPITPRLERMGEMPLPPYIHTPLKKSDEYQTIFARVAGSVAAPTAGLHFTPQVLQRVERSGVKIVKLILHIGLDTFAPVKEETAERHEIHSEWCQITERNAAILNQTRANGGRIIAVGTTTVRALETAARSSATTPELSAFEGATDLFILPGFQFMATDAMLTNFHLPRSTLLMMVSAFVGRERLLSAYQTAIEQGYRFYSFGDAMFIH